MILTTAECKTLLNITNTAKDTMIAALLPIVEDNIRKYCRNDFLHNYKNRYNDEFYLCASTIAFVASSKTITDSGSGLLTAGFISGQTVHITGSKYNDGVYYVTTAVAGTLTLDSAETLVEETAGNAVTITLVTYPKSLKIIASQMVNHRLLNQTPGVKSESIDDYSISYDDISGGYPPQILALLNNYRQVYQQRRC
jgi:hypothetical protein